MLQRHSEQRVFTDFLAADVHNKWSADAVIQWLTDEQPDSRHHSHRRWHRWHQRHGWPHRLFGVTKECAICKPKITIIVILVFLYAIREYFQRILYYLILKILFSLSILIKRKESIAFFGILSLSSFWVTLGGILKKEWKREHNCL